ncbi:hypothetical protein G5I_04939 [Acromyrmex echinatior]|uniref:Uncharacterized protein n=1 Tax=Acromyrmex echinatior TaxID=103372 RepID=F4WGY7_ACREC|nr:hypothetical protein G5I_04939 [Acromyrmex echinatior]
MQDSSSDRANGQVSETLGKAAQGSASLGRVRLPNIQALSNAACRCHRAKIHVKSRDRSTRLYRLRATAPKADELENFNELVKKLAHRGVALAWIDSREQSIFPRVSHLANRLAKSHLLHLSSLFLTLRTLLPFHRSVGTTTITHVRRANGRQPVAAAAEGTATGTAMQQQRLVEQEEKGQTPDRKKRKKDKKKKKKKKKRILREEASKLRPGLAARSPLTYQQERAALYSHDRGLPSGALDKKFRRCGGSTCSGEVEEGVLGKEQGERREEERCSVRCVTTFSSPLLREIHSRVVFRSHARVCGGVSASRAEFTIDSALAFTSPPRPGARSFAKGITTRRRERRQTDGKGDAEGKRTAKKERETVRDGEGEKEEKQEEEEEEKRRGTDRDTTTVCAKTAGGGRGFLAAARRTRILATVAWFDDEDKEVDVDERAERRLALAEREERGGGQTAIAKDESERRSGCGEIYSFSVLPPLFCRSSRCVAPHDDDVEFTKETREI